MRVLVTGGAGYVGSHVVRSLLEGGHEPVVYDNLSTGHAGAVQHAELVIGDIHDHEKLGALLRRSPFDGCVHLAADSLVGESVRNPGKYFRNNVGGGLALFDQLVAAGVPWVVLSSTAAIYGEPEAIPLREDHPKRPTSPYGESKLILEQILARYYDAHGLRHIALRYFNAAGAHVSGELGEAHSPETHLLPLVLFTAMGIRQHIEVFGADYPTPDGTAIRDYVHVCDLASAHLAAMDRLHSGGENAAFNLGNGHGFSVMEIIQQARRVTGCDIRVSLEGRRSGDPSILVASAELARKTLGWSPILDLSVIVETAWRWHESHPEGYGDAG